MKISEILRETQFETSELEPEDRVMIAQIDQKYPRAGAVVSGLTVRPEIPNLASTDGVVEQYYIMPAIREIPMAEFGGPRSVFYAADDFQRSSALAQAIAASQEINPLIIVHDQKGLYILEGSHRYVALFELKIQSFPALLVVELPELQ